jgi:molybdopterin synthase catalytic subunit
MVVKVQTEDFDISTETQALLGDRTDVGAIVTFTGLVRDHAGGQTITMLELEHYPGMTQKQLAAIEKDARQRWALDDCLIIHRYGALLPGDNIVLVLTASSHRKDAFQAAEFLMDFLKTKAPFWKKETTTTNSHWVKANDADDDAAARWGKDQ